jgi:hypothetical protein
MSHLILERDRQAGLANAWRKHCDLKEKSPT